RSTWSAASRADEPCWAPTRFGDLAGGSETSESRVTSSRVDRRGCTDGTRPLVHPSRLSVRACARAAALRFAVRVVRFVGRSAFGSDGRRDDGLQPVLLEQLLLDLGENRRVL